MRSLRKREIENITRKLRGNNEDVKVLRRHFRYVTYPLVRGLRNLRATFIGEISFWKCFFGLFNEYIVFNVYCRCNLARVLDRGGNSRKEN